MKITPISSQLLASGIKNKFQYSNNPILNNTVENRDVFVKSSSSSVSLQTPVHFMGHDVFLIDGGNHAKDMEHFAKAIDTGKNMTVYTYETQDPIYSTFGKPWQNVEEELQKLYYSGRLKKDDYVILMRLHYLVSNNIDISQFKNFVYDVSDYEDINELYIISDILVTDYSSVFFDYANLKRPILFYMYDLQEYKNNIRDFYIDLKELPGPIVESEKDLIKNIRNINNIFEENKEIYKNFNEKYNYLDNENVTSEVVKECIN